MEQHPIKRVVFAQGRRLTWLARQLGISSNYLHRVLLPVGHPDHRGPPKNFYPRVAELLGVPEDMLRPGREEVAA